MLDQTGFTGMGSLAALDSMENDAEIERQGGKGAAEYATKHWEFLLSIERQEGDSRTVRLLGDAAAPETLARPGDLWDDRLHRVFETHFGGAFGFDLEHTSWQQMHGSEMLLAKWRELLSSFEGVIIDRVPYNMLTLLRVRHFQICKLL
jgi:hypothetical protein